MRRKFHFLICVICLTALICCAETDPVGIVVPTEKQVEWAEAEVGVLIHFDMPVYKPEYNFRNWGTHPDPSVFNPTELNTDQWLEAAKELGAKYAVLVAKHGSGFSLWPTEAHDYSVKNAPFQNGQGDIVRDFIASCKKYGVKPGIYASTTANGYLYVDNPGVVQEGSPVTQEEYNNIVVKQLTELWTNYGELFEVWFDGGVLSKEKGGADVLDLIMKYQPQAIAFQGPYGHPNLIRWVGNEEGVAPDPCWATTDSTTNADGTVVIDGLHGDPFAPYWCPGEADFTLRWNRSFQGGWFWAKDQDHMIFTLDELMKKYETSVGRNTNMLLGIVIDDRGLVPDADFLMIKTLGREINKRYGTPFMQTSGDAKKLSLKFNEPTLVDRAIVQENIAKGERILKYSLKGRKGNDWITLASGTNVGHKRIITFQPETLDEIVFEVEDSKTMPSIRNFSVFKVQ